jgi:ABC-type dipeptide/oligopeptide/nickel transport system permease component
VLQENSIKTAHAKGLREHTDLVANALRTALLPTVTLIGLNFGYLLSGAVIVETILGCRDRAGQAMLDTKKAANSCSC